MWTDLLTIAVGPKRKTDFCGAAPPGNAELRSVASQLPNKKTVSTSRSVVLVCSVMLTPAEAEKQIFEHIAPFHREDCSLASAHRRVLRTEIRADRDLPPFDRVTMDGYALRSESLAAGIQVFRVEAVQAAGMRAFKLGENKDACVEVMTGAVLPEGADCVVPYEETTRQDLSVTVSEDARQFAAGNAVHRRGSDHAAGEIIVRPGVRLSGCEIAVAAACGYGTLVVTQLPKIAVVATGDELVEVETAVAPHQIRRSNDHALRAALLSAGYLNVSRFHLRDVREEIERCLRQIILEFDVVVISGGISKGKFDYLPGELDRQGVRKIFQGVAQRPGKPFWFGVTPRHKPVFALPGNPVSSYTCLHRYVLPALARASGLDPAPLPTVALTAPAKLASGPRAELLASPDPSNTSGDFGGLLGTDGFVALPASNEEFPAGSTVVFWPWV
jgi:molybdopterin molybdotransferase